SGSRANMLMGVTSNRVDVKHAAALAEVALERRGGAHPPPFSPPPPPPRRPLVRPIGVAGPPTRAGVAGGDPQRGPRLGLRVLGRRGGRRGDRALRRGAP